MSLLLLLIPLIGISLVTIETNYGLSLVNNIKIKSIALTTTIINLIVSLIMFILLILVVNNFNLLKNIIK